MSITIFSCEEKILGFLGKTKDDFGWFKVVFFEDDMLVVKTRVGGEFNREEYEYVYEEMAKHPWYDRYEDDDFDDTYVSFFFNIPKDIIKELLHFGKQV